MEFTTPVGRLVQGSCFVGNKTDNKGQPYIIKTGPNAGQPTEKFYFGVAYPKLLANGQPNEEFNTFFKNVIEVARAGYPQFFNGPIDPFTGKPGCTHPRMTFKIMDGDGVDANGAQNNTKEGFAGHWVVKFGGSFAPKCFELGKFAPEQRIQDASRIKTGYYVAVSGTCEANIGSDVPGVYMNGNLVCLIGAGAEIVGGPDANAAFAGVNVGALPPGCVVGATPASTGPAPVVPGVAAPLPVVPTPTVPVDPLATAIAAGWIAHPSSPGYFYKGQEIKAQADLLAMFAAPVVQTLTIPAVSHVPAPTLPVVPAAQTAAPLTPNMAFVTNAGTPAAVVPPLPTLPVVPAALQLNAAAVAAGYTVEMFRAQNWTDDMIRQGGFAA